MPTLFLTAFRWLKGLNLRHVLYGVAALMLGFLIFKGVGFVQDKYEAEKQVGVLERQVDDYQETLKVMEDAADQKDRAIDTADAVLTERTRLRFNYDSIRREAATVTEEEDGTVAPVLQRTLNALDGM